MPKCFFPGCHNDAVKVACPLHQNDRGRWTTHNAMLKYRGRPPISFQAYQKKHLNFLAKTKRPTSSANRTDAAGPTVKYDGSGRSPCLRCEHGQKDHDRIGCVKCDERWAVAVDGGVMPVQSHYDHLTLSLDSSHYQMFNHIT